MNAPPVRNFVELSGKDVRLTQAATRWLNDVWAVVRFDHTWHGDPNGNVTANVGERCINTMGGANHCLYLKSSGTGATGWSNVRTQL